MPLKLENDGIVKANVLVFTAEKTEQAAYKNTQKYFNRLEHNFKTLTDIFKNHHLFCGYTDQNKRDKTTEYLSSITYNLLDIYYIEQQTMHKNSKQYLEYYKKFINLLQHEFNNVKKIKNHLRNCFNNNNVSPNEKIITINQLINFSNFVANLTNIIIYHKETPKYWDFNKKVIALKNKLYAETFAAAFAQQGLDKQKPESIAIYLKNITPNNLKPYYIALFFILRQTYNFNWRYDNYKKFYKSSYGDCTEYAMAYAINLFKLGFKPKIIVTDYFPEYAKRSWSNGHFAIYLKLNQDQSLIMDNNGIWAYTGGSMSEIIFDSLPRTDYYRVIEINKQILKDNVNILNYENLPKIYNKK